ncbi:outer membrane efflux protein [Pseudopedobacter saltans DSM 12145]|uniref:Outer membrane efflux protein n=1 Tax=Pseudopedobacter saltans (strain ATCC 51119 / DSM 12145 / JCM 21818 / CCUG 39354 / LMG 10337 / NBRC 100064 / NCIMB 13643) TaxID=762903 RepID=F0SCZ3_PSESL|nr:TolC family protein [Pseudopedobacter saltans]ADY51750.1 outer membrane efflux protein [Pseudopedobacter saltans DSM 12145]
MGKGQSVIQYFEASFKTSNRFRRLMLICTLIVLIAGFSSDAQQSLTLNIKDVYQYARNNYPLINQRGLIIKAAEFTVSNAAKGYFPMLSVNGQATYQSTVTSFPFTLPLPGFSVPKYGKDQYKIYGQIDQVIYDGGMIGNQKQMAKTTAKIQEQSLEVDLYQLYDRVNQLFFGVILLNEQLKQNELVLRDIQNGIDKAKALVANGVAYRSSVDELMAQKLQTEQARVELKATRKAYMEMLSQFINLALNENTVFEKPISPVLTGEFNRPELLLYNYQQNIYDDQKSLLNAQLRPRFFFFLQGGYARPGLNMLSNDFAWYYIGGLKLSWNLGSLYTYGNQKKILEINKTMIDLQKETFLFNMGLIQKQQQIFISKFTELLKNDEAIIKLRESVKKASAAQLENGVLSAHDYISVVNAEDQARQNFILHQIQMLQEQYNYQNTMGNTIN